jgi:protein-tyrosine-phosphatase
VVERRSPKPLVGVRFLHRPQMKKVVFICHDNMFRSPMAVAIYNNMVKDGSVAEGYGTCAEIDGRVGKILSDFPELIPDLEFMMEKGINISNFPCRQVTPEYVEGVSKIIMMAEMDSIPDWFKDYPYEYWTVLNPLEVTRKTTEDTYELLYKKISDLISSDQSK